MIDGVLAHQLLADVLLVGPIGRTIGAKENFGAFAHEMFADPGMPDVFADRDADRDALDGDRERQWTGGEIALFEEDVGIGQFALEAERGDLALFADENGIVEAGLVVPDGGENEDDIVETLIAEANRLAAEMGPEAPLGTAQVVTA